MSGNFFKLTFILSLAFILNTSTEAVKKFRISNYDKGHQIWFEAEDYDERNPDDNKYYDVIPEKKAPIPAKTISPKIHKPERTVNVEFVGLLYRKLNPTAIRYTRQKANRSIPAKKVFRNSPCSPIPRTPKPVKIIKFSVMY